MFLSARRESNAPNPTVVLLPDTVTVAKSASLASKRPVAAQPPLLSKSVRRNSSNHTIPVFERPSSVADVELVRNGLRTPTITAARRLRSGWPLIVILLRPSDKVNGTFSGHGCPLSFAL